MVGVWIFVGALIAIAVVFGVQNTLMRRGGYAIPGRTVVRCRAGHVFRTTWIEGGSLKAVRLGPTTQYQRCPVGHHLAIVHPVKEEELTEDDRRALGRAEQPDPAS